MAAAILVALGAIFIAQFHLDWDLNPSYNYGWLVPFLAGYLFWARWTQRPAAVLSPAKKSTAAIALAGAATLLLPLRIAAKANPDWRLVGWGVALSLLSIILAFLYRFGGPRWVRHFCFPAVFCLVAVPWPTLFEQAAVHRLMRLVAAINVDLLSICGVSALRHGSVIELATGALGVEDACSGIRSLQSTLMLSLFFGEFYLLVWWKRIALVAIASALAFLLNIGRTFFLAWVAQRDGIPAIDQWHDFAGWAVIVTCLAVLWAVSSWMSCDAGMQMRGVASPAVCFPVGPLLALGGWLVIVEAGSSAWFHVREKQVQVAAPWTISGPAADQAEEIPIPKAAADLLHYNEGRAIAWQEDEGKRWELFYFRWRPGRTAALSVKIHRPEICLPASGFVAEGAVRSQLLHINGVSLPVRAYRFRDSREPIHVYYCYWDGTVFRDTEEMIREDWTLRGRLRRIWSGRRERGAQTLEILVWGHEDEASADAAFQRELERFVQPAT